MTQMLPDGNKDYWYHNHVHTLHYNMLANGLVVRQGHL